MIPRRLVPLLFSALVAGALALGSSCGGKVANKPCGVPCRAIAPSTAACIEDRCIVTLSAPGGDPSALAVDVTSVYWTDPTQKRISKVPIGGGEATVLTSNQESGALAVRDDTIYWNTEDNGLMRMSKSGGPLVSLGGGSEEFGSDIAVDATSLYWVDFRGFVKKVDRRGGVFTVLVSNLPPSTAIAADAKGVYWSTSEGDLKGSDIEGGHAVLLDSFPHSADAMALDSVNVYLANPSDGTIAKVARDGSISNILVRGDLGLTGIAVDATSVYWLGGGGTINKVPIAGGPVTSIAPGRGADLAVDDTSVYWTDYATHAVMKVTPK